MKKILISSVISLLASSSFAAEWQMGDERWSVDTLFRETVCPGVTTIGLRLNGKTNVFYSVIDLTEPCLEIHAVKAKDANGMVENVKLMGERMTAKGNGIYMAGINGDFFDGFAVNGVPPTNDPIGHFMADSKLYYTCKDAGWETWASYAMVYNHKDIDIEMDVNARHMIKTATKELPVHIDVPRESGYMVIYTPAFGTSTKTDNSGRECLLKLVSGSIDKDNAVFEIASEGVDSSTDSNCGNMTIPSDGYVLSASGVARLLMRNLHVGDQITLKTSVTVNGNEVTPTAIVGGASILVDEGEIVDDKYFSANIVDHFTSNQARTAVGYNKDHSKLFMLVVDKYTQSQYTTADAKKKTYGTSSGITVKQVAQMMHNLGCYKAMNCDGGGSSQLYNNQKGIINVPYGADYLRPVATGLFVVSVPESSGIEDVVVNEDIIAESDAIEYYNLQGIRVINPEKGFYLIKNNNKVSKILLQ